MSNLLELNAVSVALRRGDEIVRAIDKVSLTFHSTQWTALVGNNGSGKSTLAKVMAGLSECSAGTMSYASPPNGPRIRLILQNPDAQIVGQTVGEDILFGIELSRAKRTDGNVNWNPVMHQALQRVGLDVPLDMPIEVLSGGEKQLLCVAAAIVSEPQWLICDEVTSHLDWAARERVMAAISNLQTTHGIGVIWITQQMPELARADRVVALHTGRVVYDGSARAFLYNTCATLGYTPPYVVQVALALTNRGLLLPGQPLTESELVAALNTHTTKVTSHMYLPDRYLPDCPVAGPTPAGDTQRTLSCHALRVLPDKLASATSKSDPPALLDEVDLSLKPGQITLLVGRTGAGKSTLLRSLAGLVRPASGLVSVDGLPLRVKGRTVAAALKRIELVFQAPERQFFRPTLAAEFNYSLRPFRLPDSESKRRTNAALDAVLLPSALLGVSPAQLSGGQQRRSALATSISTVSPWYLLDEPTAGLDGESTQAVLNWATSAARAQDCGLLVATHDLDAWMPVAHRIVVLGKGRIIADTSVTALCAQPSALVQANVGVPAFLSTPIRLRAMGVSVPHEMHSPDVLADWIVRANTRRSPGPTPDLSKNPTGNRGDSTSERVRPPEQVGTAQSYRRGRDKTRHHLDLDTLDPRAKWLSYVVLSISLLSVHPLALIPGTIACGCLLRYSRVGPLTVWRLARVFLLFTGMAVAFAGFTWNPAVQPAAASVMRLQNHLGWSWSEGRATLVSLYRVLLILVLGVVFSESTSSLQMKKGLEAALRWLQPMKVPVEAVAFGASLVLHFVPLMVAETKRFAEIAQVRGKRSSRLGRINLRSAPSVIIPLLLAIFRLGEELSFAMEARGLVEFGTHPIQRLPRPRRPDVLAVATALAGAAALWLIP